MIENESTSASRTTREKQGVAHFRTAQRSYWLADFMNLAPPTFPDGRLVRALDVVCESFQMAYEDRPLAEIIEALGDRFAECYMEDPPLAAGIFQALRLGYGKRGLSDPEVQSRILRLVKHAPLGGKAKKIFARLLGK